jgi:hypothetical protein
VHLLLGLAMILPPPALVAPALVVVCLASFPVLSAAGLYDQRRHRRGQQRTTGSPRPTDAWASRSNILPSKRRSVPIFPRGLVYFRHWRALRWFVLLLSPVCASAAASWTRGRDPGQTAIILLLGAAVAAVLFVTLCSGVESSNWGTWRRRSEPICYWLHVGVVGLAYVGLALAAWFA